MLSVFAGLLVLTAASCKEEKKAAEAPAKEEAPAAEEKPAVSAETAKPEVAEVAEVPAAYYVMFKGSG